MFKTTKHIQRFDLSNRTEVEQYEAILNDPLCTIIHTRDEKLTEKVFDEESGKMTYMREYLIVVVTWQEKELL